MAPKKPDMVIIVSVVISRLCTGHLVSRSTIYSFPQMSGMATTKKKERKVHDSRAKLASHSRVKSAGCYRGK